VVVIKKNIDISMLDGSQYLITDEDWITAINTRKEENKNWITEFCSCVETHWKSKTIPTKFCENIPWEKEYKNHSELAPDVIYPYIRSILMGLMLKKMNSKASVLALNDDGSVSEYPKKK
jgi:hypothetical protein